MKTNVPIVATKDATTCRGTIHRAHGCTTTRNDLSSKAIKRAKRLLLLFVSCLAVAIACIGPVACTRQGFKGCRVTSEDYAVYSAILLDVEKQATSYDKPILIIFEETRSTEYYHPDIWDTRSSVQGASDETVVHFKSRQKCSSHLKAQFDPEIPYRLVFTRDLIGTLGKGGGGFDEFHKDNPKSFGIWYLSPAGYNTKETEAMVYVEHICGGLCASGSLFVLEKETGHWTVKNRIDLWIS